MVKSTAATKPRKASRRSSSGKPGKPYDGFPLFDHNSGRWAKKIKGKLHYFGYWVKRENGKLTRIGKDGNWKAALELYEQQREDL